MFPKAIQKLIDLFSKFPTVGPRTASRFVFYLLKKSSEEINELTKAITNLKQEVKTCSFCFNYFENDNPLVSLCPICSNPSRDKNIICIVEKENDLASLEKIKKYNGLYFILGGPLSKFKENSLKEAKLQELIKKIKNPASFGINRVGPFQEIILALNATTEGEMTRLYLERNLAPLGIKITHLGRGLPVGGELEYADEETLASAIENRK